MPEEDEADERNHDAFFDEFLAQRGDRAFDELAAVVGGDEFDPFGERGFDLLQLFLNAVDDAQRVFAVSHDNNPAHDFPFAVEFRHATADIGAEVDGADVLHIYGRAFLGLEWDGFNVCDAFDVAAAAHEKLRRRDLENFPARVRVAGADGADNIV